MERFAAATLILLSVSPALAAEPPKKALEPSTDFQCRPANWAPPWNRQHCKEHEGMWVNGKCTNARWVIVECRMP